MITKELIDARWKIIIGALLTIAAAVFTVYSYELVKDMMATMDVSQLPEAVREEVLLTASDFATSTWTSWFRSTGVQILAVLAAFLGGSLIAGEVSKGTIHFLLSKPVSRDRVLITKYAVGVLVLLALSLLGGATLMITAALFGYQLDLGGVLISTLLLWLGLLFVLGVALLLSTVFDDILRPIGLAVLITALLGLPALIPNWQDWNLSGYWVSLPAFKAVEFPAKEFAINLVAAALPAALALVLFRRKAY